MCFFRRNQSLRTLWRYFRRTCRRSTTHWIWQSRMWRSTAISPPIQLIERYMKIVPTHAQWARLLSSTSPSLTSSLRTALFPFTAPFRNWSILCRLWVQTRRWVGCLVPCARLPINFSPSAVPGPPPPHLHPSFRHHLLLPHPLFLHHRPLREDEVGAFGRLSCWLVYPHHCLCYYYVPLCVCSCIHVHVSCQIPLSLSIPVHPMF